MSLTKTIRYEKRQFAIGETARAITRALNSLNLDPSNQRFSHHETLSDGTEREQSFRIEDLETICGPDIDLRFFDGKSSTYFALSSCGITGLSLHIQAKRVDTIAMIRQAFEDTLTLTELPLAESPGPPGTDEDLQTIARRLDALESIVLAPRQRLRCFLSYRFNESTEIPALRITQFLTLLDVEVVSGESYEPRRISEKVLSRLQQPLDFIVLLLTTDGESMWTRDEIAAASHKGISLIPIVEKGAQLGTGLLADIEYVQYPKGYVGEAFLKLLEAVCFIRQQKQLEVDYLPQGHEEGEGGGS